MRARPRTAPATRALAAVRAVRPSDQEIEECILDAAAALFAQLGYERTSVQRIADDTGYSKTGLLHKFGSKEQLHDAVRERCLATFAGATSRARTREPGPARDREIVAALVDLAVQRPGFIALLLSGVTPRQDDDTAWVHRGTRELLDSGFGLDDTTPLSRRMRVLGCLGALGVGAAATAEFPAHEVHAEREATCCAVLGL